MSDIVERLRYCGKELADHYSHAAIFDEAADEIERRRAALDNEKRWNATLEITARKDAEQARSDALEEAAKVAELHIREPGLSDNPAYIRYEPADNMAKKISYAIRALKEKAND